MMHSDINTQIIGDSFKPDRDHIYNYKYDLSSYIHAEFIPSSKASITPYNIFYIIPVVACNHYNVSVLSDIYKDIKNIMSYDEVIDLYELTEYKGRDYVLYKTHEMSLIESLYILVDAYGDNKSQGTYIDERFTFIDRYYIRQAVVICNDLDSLMHVLHTLYARNRKQYSKVCAQNPDLILYSYFKTLGDLPSTFVNSYNDENIVLKMIGEMLSEVSKQNMIFRLNTFTYFNLYAMLQMCKLYKKFWNDFIENGTPEIKEFFYKQTIKFTFIHIYGKKIKLDEVDQFIKDTYIKRIDWLMNKINQKLNFIQTRNNYYDPNFKNGFNYSLDL